MRASEAKGDFLKSEVGIGKDGLLMGPCKGM